LTASEVAGLRGRFVGCLVGGAIGDALGAPVEFLSWAAIRSKFGAGGVRGYARAYGRLGAITDDTQMTLFTAEGLIRARNRGAGHELGRGPVGVPRVIHRAYERWASTQVDDAASVPWDPETGDGSTSGWLIAQRFLHDRRAPGNTCLSALFPTHRIGTLEEPINQSKGCGAVMRSAPVGLAGQEPFDLACRAAALTHGHPSGWIAAGALAVMVSEVAAGLPLARAADQARDRCRRQPRGHEVATALDHAIALARDAGAPGVSQVESLGAGWVAEEALSISVYCALRATSFRAGVLLAVNHSGDSDSTGSITGNLLGTALGMEGVDADLFEGLEGGEVISRVGEDMYDAFACGRPVDLDRYPPW
jgi:ADP-ribosyl-[dinitrogen reductase] hydrolase